MKKLIAFACAAVLLSGCYGFVQGKSKTTGEQIYDLYILHPVISTKYIARL